MSTDTNQTAGSPGSHGPGGLTRPEPDKSSAGRIYDYMLGGRTWFEVDRRSAESVLAVMPEARDAAHLNRTFLQRSVRAMAERGVRQFLDIGAGLPTMFNTDETAHAIHPDARIVYVDHDPIVVEDAKDLLRQRDASNVAYIQAEFRDPASILDHPDTRALIDFDQPIGHLHMALWHFLSDDEDLIGLRDQYLDRSVSGSYLAISHATAKGQDPASVERLGSEYARAGAPMTFRDEEGMAMLFQGLELLPPYEGAAPGFAVAGAWGSHHPEEIDEAGSWIFCGVGRKP